MFIWCDQKLESEILRAKVVFALQNQSKIEIEWFTVVWTKIIKNLLWQQRCVKTVCLSRECSRFQQHVTKYPPNRSQSIIAKISLCTFTTKRVVASWSYKWDGWWDTSLVFVFSLGMFAPSIGVQQIVQFCSFPLTFICISMLTLGNPMKPLWKRSSLVFDLPSGDETCLRDSKTMPYARIPYSPPRWQRWQFILVCVIIVVSN